MCTKERHAGKNEIYKKKRNDIYIKKEEIEKRSVKDLKKTTTTGILNEKQRKTQKEDKKNKTAKRERRKKRMT